MIYFYGYNSLLGILTNSQNSGQVYFLTNSQKYIILIYWVYIYIYIYIHAYTHKDPAPPEAFSQRSSRARAAPPPPGLRLPAGLILLLDYYYYLTIIRNTTIILLLLYYYYHITIIRPLPLPSLRQNGRRREMPRAGFFPCVLVSQTQIR